MTRKTLARGALAAFVAAFAAGQASAHHSGAMFDSEKVLTLAGTAKELQWTNPHVWLIVDVPGAAGKVTEWHFEGISPFHMTRRGWKKSSIKPGDKVVVTTHPMKSGEPAGNIMKVSVNGTVIGEQPQ